VKTVWRIAVSLLFVAFVFCSGGAQAQVLSGYVTVSPTHISNAINGYVGAQEQPNTTSFTPIGLGGGVSVRLLALPSASVALDLRGATRAGLFNAMDMGEFGIKLGLSPHSKLKPYVEGATGFLATHLSNTSDAASRRQQIDNSITSHYAVVQGIAGVDYRLAPFLDWRIAELGYGTSYAITPRMTLFTANTGVVLHF
jgi:hypothetical protein